MRLPDAYTNVYTSIYLHVCMYVQRDVRRTRETPGGGREQKRNRRGGGRRRAVVVALLSLSVSFFNTRRSRGLTRSPRQQTDVTTCGYTCIYTRYIYRSYARHVYQYICICTSYSAGLPVCRQPACEGLREEESVLKGCGTWRVFRRRREKQTVYLRESSYK